MAEPTKHVIINLILKGVYLDKFEAIAKDFPADTPRTKIINQLLLNHKPETQLSFIDKSVANDIKFLQEYTGILGVDDMIRFIIKEKVREIRKTEIGDSLNDPKVQARLNVQEREIAKEILFGSQEEDNYGGLTQQYLEHTNKLHLTPEQISTIITKFAVNKWIIITEDNKILPT